MSLKDFLYGAASVLDLSGSMGMAEVEEILNKSDTEAIRSDWEAIGQDMWKAIGQFETDQNVG